MPVGETPLLDWPGVSNTFPVLLSPSWLLQDPEMQLRTTYKGFTEAVDAYFDRLMSIVVPLQASTILVPPQGWHWLPRQCGLCDSSRVRWYQMFCSRNQHRL